ncbi:hybrid sensor histidine kinase/response regulator [Ramlibacter sp.]|uniref:hybrid sensor histidine kinase/response regulator n=1 Tax=Ramlibacter sp. TaxID=1917967 RepID=UPI003D0BAB7C
MGNDGVSQEVMTNILLVDDLQENLVALEALIRAPGRRCHLARSGEDALALMLDHEFALAILDVQMPAMNGFELAEMMRSTDRTRRIPIVFVTAAGGELNYSFRGYESGAVDVLYKPLDTHAVRGKVNVFVDLYRQRVALEAARAELERAVEMRDDFMSMVSHELRTPLNTLYLQAQLRLKMLDKDPGALDMNALRKMAERDDRQVRGMVRLIDDMLDVARLRSGHLAIVPAPADLADVARRTVENFTEQARTAGTEITIDAPAALPAECDAFRIEQVLANLVSNALRYGGGSPVHVKLTDAGSEALLSVRDGGMGIAPEDQERIFAQFERVNGPQKVAGLGLGLYITRQIVRSHGGDITVRSAPGEGAEFTVHLPRHMPPPAPSHAPA